MSKTPEQRAAELTPRERKRLRRNYIMWEGRLQRAKESLDFARELAAENEDDPVFAIAPDEIAEREESVQDCRERLAKARREIEAALGVDLC